MVDNLSEFLAEIKDFGTRMHKIFGYKLGEPLASAVTWRKKGTETWTNNKEGG